MSTRFTISDLQRSRVSSINPELNLAPKLRAKTIKAGKKEPEGLRHIKEVLWMLKLDYQTEYAFHPARKWRADVAVLEHKLLIEYEGICSEKSRHTNIEGYSNDARKYNQCQLHGFKILRYTPLTYKEFYNELKMLIDF